MYRYISFQKSEQKSLNILAFIGLNVGPQMKFRLGLTFLGSSRVRPKSFSLFKTLLWGPELGPYRYSHIAAMLSENCTLFAAM